jgi:NAD(P)-dependent dehydrogenase (short-subunit alcohol dehydrogenase family)
MGSRDNEAMAIGNLIRGATFFTTFLPSFSSLGYRARSRSWEPYDPDFSGQRWLVTGASTGIGREIARRAAHAGAEVIAVARSAERLESLADDIAGHQAAGIVRPLSADLSLIGEVAALVGCLGDRSRPLDVLINNVGVMLDRCRLTPEGMDAAFSTNLLGHYLLTEGLLRRSGLAAGAAVIGMSSGGMYNVPLDLTRLQGGEPYDGTLAYAYHKRAQVSLNGHWRQRYGDRSTFYVMHPGWVDTPGVEGSMPDFHRTVGRLLRTPAAGADTALWLAGRRPAQAGDTGIWFDRALRSEHLLPGTRGGADREELVAYLERQAESAAGNARAA